MTGHLHDFWPDVGPNSGWLGGTGESWERGPLLYSYAPGENWVELRDRSPFMDWQVFPDRAWNYALQVNEQTAPRLTVRRPNRRRALQRYRQAGRH